MLDLRLYGTGFDPAERRVISAGQLSFVFQSGALRHLSIGGVEAIRGIAFVVRDENWGTYLPELSDLEVFESPGGIRISYRAVCRGFGQALEYDALIEGSPDGGLQFTVKASAQEDFLTNRTGFVVLHPIDDVAGRPVTVTHTDGSTEESNFPTLISPSQPFFNIRALRHQLVSGVSVTCTMEGDVFEMEDQRNWSDASFKTYSRPLSKPYPYVLNAGQKFVRRVGLSVEGALQHSTRPDSAASCAVSIKHETVGRMPDIALAVDATYAKASLGLTSLVKLAGVSHLFCTFDAFAGHGVETMRFFKRMGEESGASLILEAVLPLRNKAGQFTDEWDVLKADVAAIRQAADDAGTEFGIISVSPACYLKSFQPNGDWPMAPSLRSVYEVIRQAFSRARVAGGMHSYFTELNRFRPPADSIDIVTHSTCPIVHAADDVSVMESLQALPWIFQSVHEFFKGKPYWIGPTAIAMRMNPYGSGTVPNARQARRAMAEADPRQRGLFNAAWTLGYAARAAKGGVAGLCLSSVAGPSALAWHQTHWHQPWFDDQGSGNLVYPVYHVIAGLASRAGAALLATDCTNTNKVAALALEADDGPELWLANLTAQKYLVNLRGLGPEIVIETLDAETFEVCCAGPGGLLETSTTSKADTVWLGAYAVVRIHNA